MERVALVTGSSRGIGRAVAAELAREGWAVCVNYIQHQQAAEDAVRAIRDAGGRAVAVQADVADGAAVAEMVRRAERELGGHVSLLVNNAGVAGQAQFQDITDEMWDRYLAVNLGGARNTIRAVLPRMISEKAGCIVNISSIWGLRGASCEVAYACTKAAVIALILIFALRVDGNEARQIALEASGGGEVIQETRESEGLWNEYEFVIQNGDTWYSIEIGGFGRITEMESGRHGQLYVE